MDSSRRSAAPRPAGRGRSRSGTSPTAKGPLPRSRGGRAAGGRAQGKSRNRRTHLTSRAAVLALVACALVLTLTYPTREYFAQRAQIAELRKQTDDQRRRVDEQRRQLARWNDPAFVKAQARERLHFVMPGETGYVVVDPSGKGGQDGSGEDGKAGRDGSESRSWLEDLADSVEGAANGTPPASPR